MMPKDKELLRELVKNIKIWNKKSTLKLLRGPRSIPSEEIQACIKEAIIHGKFIQPFDKKKRKKRNSFLIDLSAYFNSKSDFDSSKLIDYHIHILEVCEILYDKLWEESRKHDFQNLSKEIQVWALIGHAEKMFKAVFQKVDQQYDAQADSKKGYTSAVALSGMNIEFEEGRKVDPDAVVERIIESLAACLKMWANKNCLHESNQIVLGRRSPASEKDIEKAGSDQITAVVWNSIKQLYERLICFGGRVEAFHDVRSRKTIYDFEIEACDPQKWDFLARIRLNNIFAQQFMQYLTAAKNQSPLNHSITASQSIADGKFLSSYEENCIINLSNLFSNDVYSDRTLYGGVYIMEWVRAYAVVMYFSENISDDNLVGEKDIIQVMQRVGVRKKATKVILNRFIFGHDSKDLYDAPFLRVDANNIYLLVEHIKRFNLPLVVLSQLSSLGELRQEKGNDFEKTVHYMMNMYGITCKSLKFKINKEQYQCDAIILMDDIVFVVECKNKLLSSGLPKRIYAFDRDMRDAEKQVSRLVQGIVNYPEPFEEKFGKRISNLKLVPVILNNFPYSKIIEDNNEVMFSDMSSFSRFFSSASINKHIYLGKEKESHISKEVFAMWKGEKPTGEELIEHLKNPFQLSVINPYLTVRSSSQTCDDNTGLVFSYFDLERDAYRDDNLLN